jgi:hypothetical protein
MSKNDITGDKLVSKVQSEKFSEGYDRIWGKSRSVVFDVPKEVNAPVGYTAEELDRDNPYNQWMYEGENK